MAKWIFRLKGQYSSTPSADGDPGTVRIQAAEHVSASEVQGRATVEFRRANTRTNPVATYFCDSIFGWVKQAQGFTVFERDPRASGETWVSIEGDFAEPNDLPGTPSQRVIDVRLSTEAVPRAQVLSEWVSSYLKEE